MAIPSPVSPNNLRVKIFVNTEQPLIPTESKTLSYAGLR